MLNRRAVVVIVAAGALISFRLPAFSADKPPMPAEVGGGWLQLFNGQDLTGWTPKIVGHAAGENYADTFRVKDGVLSVSYDKYDGPFNDRFGHLFYKEPFSNYLLRLEYRLVGEQVAGGPDWARANSGIMIHGQSPESMGRDQLFPVSIEVQLLAANPGETRPTANVCTPGTHVVLDGKLHTPHTTNSKSKSYPVSEWVAVEIEVHGDKLIRHKINGETVLEYSGSQLDEKDADAQQLLAAGASREITGGTISLQSESHPVEFRKVELKRLAE
jgi:hypothetical protein